MLLTSIPPSPPPYGLRKYHTSQRQSGSVTTTVEYEKDTLVDRVETLVDRVEIHEDSSLVVADVEWAADEHSYGNWLNMSKSHTSQRWLRASPSTPTLGRGPTLCTRRS